MKNPVNPLILDILIQTMILILVRGGINSPLTSFQTKLIAKFRLLLVQLNVVLKSVFLCVHSNL